VLFESGATGAWVRSTHAFADSENCGIVIKVGYQLRQTNLLHVNVYAYLES